MKQRKELSRHRLSTPSYNGAVLPAFVLNSSEHPSYVRLLFVSSCCVECVRISQYQCPLDNEFHFPECRRRSALSTPSFSQFRRQVLEHIDCLRTQSPAQFDADRLDRVRTLPHSCSRTSSFSHVRPCVAACPPILADPSMFVRAVGLLIVTSSHCSSFEPGIVATTSILATLIFSIPFSLRPLRCDSLQVNCGSHPAKLSGKAVSNSVVDPCSPRLL